jgi:ribosomal protein L31
MYSSVKKDLVLSTDNLNHSAWTGQRSNATEKGQRTSKFNKKFAGFKF